MKLREIFGIFVRGVAMGAADVVPGVSGGTIAFITGIYPRLIACLTSFNLEALNLVVRFKIAAAWKHVDANFLLALFAGIFCSIFSLAHLISFMLESYPVVIWSFFLGLIFASAIWMLRSLPGFRLSDLVPMAAGILIILLISISPAAQLSPVLPLVFLSGFIAISAMLLPGISGSFLLLLMGLYASTVDAVKGFDLAYLMTFAAGAGFGFLAFSRVINWLLNRYYRPTLLFLIGLLIGSLYVVWPWKLPEGELSRNVLPASYAENIGDPMLLWSVLALVLGIALVISFELVFGADNEEPSD